MHFNAAQTRAPDPGSVPAPSLASLKLLVWDWPLGLLQL